MRIPLLATLALFIVPFAAGCDTEEPDPSAGTTLADRELGLVRVKVIKHEGEHPSVPANGIVPTKWGPYHTSYTIERVDVE